MNLPRDCQNSLATDIVSAVDETLLMTMNSLASTEELMAVLITGQVEVHPRSQWYPNTLMSRAVVERKFALKKRKRKENSDQSIQQKPNGD